MNIFENAEFIWTDDSRAENSYAEFSETIEYDGGKAWVRVSVCGDYTLFVNGNYASSNQYGDFGHFKVYDEIDITHLLKNGKNTVCLLSWYFGEAGMRHFTPVPGVIYEIICGQDVVVSSGKLSLSRSSRAYKSGWEKKISPQLGYSFFYDASAEDDWLCGGTDGFSPSVVTQEKRGFHKRPVKKLELELCDMRKGKITGDCEQTSKKAKHFVIDLGEEVVGLPSMRFTSEKKQNICVSYGELLENGHVKRIIGMRDFSFDYTAKAGENSYINYMLRLACRYMEIECEDDICLESIGIIPQLYPTVEKSVSVSGELDRKIYDICINTLKLCMMEHYVDCPWREQCLYAFDARNQMLSGYYAFEGGNFDYARANLELMINDNRPDGLLSICFPSGRDMVIPSFSLYFIIALKEYFAASGCSDIVFRKEAFRKAENILRVFLKNSADGLVCRFDGESRWNFYDWSPYADVERGKAEKQPDFLINSIVVMALRAFADICGMLSEKNEFEGVAESIAQKAHDKFFDTKSGMFFVSDPAEEPTELANSLAILSGIARESEVQNIAGALADEKLVSCSLSMKTLKYDALLAADSEKYSSAVLDEIRRTYKIMLDAGSTTVWETIEGASAFDNAGSLCHGWSAIPVYYYHILGIVQQK